MKKFCSFVREHATNVINFEKEKITFNKTELKLHYDATASYIFGKKQFAKDKNY